MQVQLPKNIWQPAEDGGNGWLHDSKIIPMVKNKRGDKNTFTPSKYRYMKMALQHINLHTDTTSQSPIQKELELGF